MRKWEYTRIVVYFLIYHKINDWVQYAFSNETQVMENVDSLVFFDYLNQQGKEGWEMISANSYNEGTHVETYFLKRHLK